MKATKWNVTEKQGKELEGLLKEVVDLLMKLDTSGVKTVLGEKMHVTVEWGKRSIKITIK